MTELVRARIVVKGNLEQVGYRAFVKLVARAIGIRGAARLLDDGSIEIYAEGTKDYIEKFVKLIDRKEQDKIGKLESLFSMNVKKIDIFYKYSQEKEDKKDEKKIDLQAGNLGVKEDKKTPSQDYVSENEPEEFGPFFVDYGEDSQILEMLDTQILFLTMLNSKSDTLAIKPEIIPIKRD